MAGLSKEAISPRVLQFPNQPGLNYLATLAAMHEYYCRTSIGVVVANSLVQQKSTLAEEVVSSAKESGVQYPQVDVVPAMPYTLSRAMLRYLNAWQRQVLAWQRQVLARKSGFTRAVGAGD